VTTILLTGFEPFAGAPSNSSWDALELVAEAWSGNAELVVELLPVTFAGASTAMQALIDRHSPDLVIGVGLAEGRDAVTPERKARNLQSARIPDNDGDQPVDRPVVAGGPATYASGLPVDAIVEELLEAGIPGRASEDAGTYVCNSLMYSTMRAVDGTDVVAGFVHVPCSRQLGEALGKPWIELDDIAHALEIAIEVSLRSIA
jgi:pyroglutamyl-peptidase